MIDPLAFIPLPPVARSNFYSHVEPCGLLPLLQFKLSLARVESATYNTPSLSLPRCLDWSRWRIRSCFRSGCGLGGRSLARGNLRWRRLGYRLDSWWCGFLPWARRVSLRAIHPPVANNFLRFGNFYSAFKTVDCHFVLYSSRFRLRRLGFYRQKRQSLVQL